MDQAVGRAGGGRAILDPPSSIFHFPLLGVLVLVSTSCANRNPERTLHYRVPPVEYEQHEPTYKELPLPNHFR